MNKKEKQFLSDLSLTFDVLDERRCMCFYLACGMSVDEAKQQTDTWVAEMHRADIKTIHGLREKFTDWFAPLLKRK